MWQTHTNTTQVKGIEKPDELPLNSWLIKQTVIDGMVQGHRNNSVRRASMASGRQC